MGIYYSAIAQGLLYSLMGIGLYITFRILNFADLTSEASFSVGAAVAVKTLTLGLNPVLSLITAFVAGMLTGLVTGLLMTYFEIPSLLAGIITLTAFYSINLRIMERANLSLRQVKTLYDLLTNLLADSTSRIFLVGIILTLIVILLLGYFFKTDLGQSMVASGDNEVMAHSLGISVKLMKCLALMASNGIIAMSGALIAQQNGYADVDMGTGTVIIALSSIIIGEMLFKQLTLTMRLGAIVLGSVLYRLLLVAVLKLGFLPSDFRLISALVLAIFLALPAMRKKLQAKKLG